MLARAGRKGDSIATPSICLCIILLKLNSTEHVAVCINSTNILRRKGGGVRTLLYRASAQISIVSARGTSVKRLETSKEQRKTEGERSELRRVSTKVKESLMQ